MTKIALVTGAGSGIGRATAQLLADRGFGVITTYHRNPADHVSLPLDVADTSTFPAFADSVRSALGEHWQRDTFDYLVNNAGIGGPSPFAGTTDEAYERYHRTLLKGPFFLTQALLPLLSDHGAIVNVGSSSTRPGVTTPGYAAYAAMKGGMDMLTRYLAKELAPIRVNAVSPARGTGVIEVLPVGTARRARTWATAGSTSTRSSSRRSWPRRPWTGWGRATTSARPSPPSSRTTSRGSPAR